MTWDERIDKIQKVIDLLVKAEVHAFVMVGMGAIMILHGAKEEGQLIVGAGLAVFKGNR